MSGSELPEDWDELFINENDKSNEGLVHARYINGIYWHELFIDENDKSNEGLVHARYINMSIHQCISVSDI